MADDKPLSFPTAEEMFLALPFTVQDSIVPPTVEILHSRLRYTITAAGRKKKKQHGGMAPWRARKRNSSEDWTPERRERQREICRRNGAAGSRVGVPNGMSRKQMDQIRSVALAEAKIIVERLIKMAKVTVDEKDAMGREALEFAVSVVRAQMDSTADRLKAAKLVIDVCLERPVQKNETMLTTTEDWLKSVADEEQRSSDQQ